MATLPTSVDDLYLEAVSAGQHLDPVTTVGVAGDPEIDRGVTHPELTKRHLRRVSPAKSSGRRWEANLEVASKMPAATVVASSSKP